MEIILLHVGSAGSTVILQKEHPWFEFWPSSLLLGVRVVISRVQRNRKFGSVLYFFDTKYLQIFILTQNMQYLNQMLLNMEHQIAQN